MIRTHKPTSTLCASLGHPIPLAHPHLIHPANQSPDPEQSSLSLIQTDTPHTTRPAASHSPFPPTQHFSFGDRSHFFPFIWHLGVSFSTHTKREKPTYTPQDCHRPRGFAKPAAAARFPYRSLHCSNRVTALEGPYSFFSFLPRDGCEAVIAYIISHSLLILPILRATAAKLKSTVFL